MQNSALALENEAAYRIPSMLAELLGEPPAVIRSEPAIRDSGADFIATDGSGRQWVFEVKASSGPGVIASAAHQLQVFDDDGAIPVLVVPYMTPAGAKVAAEIGLNWLDLSGNAHIRDRDLFVLVQGKPNAFRSRGRPSSPFAPRSARVARVLLLDPARWWKQRDLVESTRLDDGRISRIVKRLDEERLLERREGLLRPRNPDLLLDAWADHYRFDRHDIIVGHASGGGIELARELSGRLDELHIGHALTGLPAAWLLDPVARFRLNTVYVHGDPRSAADQLELRLEERGANVQLVAPNDQSVFAGGQQRDRLPIVSPVQIYLDLLQLPERAREAAEDLRVRGLLWNAP